MNHFLRNIRSLGGSFKRTGLGFSVIGGVAGYFLSLAFEPLLKSVMYSSIADVVTTISIFAGFGIAVLLVYMYGAQFPRRRAFELFFLGVSIMSFLLAGVSIFAYPSMISSINLNWVTYGRDVHFAVGGYVFSLSTFIYLIARTLWSIFIGSFFALMDRFLKVLKP